MNYVFVVEGVNSRTHDCRPGGRGFYLFGR